MQAEPRAKVGNGSQHEKIRQNPSIKRPLFALSCPNPENAGQNPENPGKSVDSWPGLAAVQSRVLQCNTQL